MKYYLIFSLFLTSCSITTADERGSTLSKQYCSSCHAYPDPSLLDTLSWSQHVLPEMGKLLGLKYYNGTPFEDISTGTDSSGKTVMIRKSVSLEEWKLIEAFYHNHAPAKLEAQDRAAITNYTNLFSVHGIVDTTETPASVFVKIDEESRMIYCSNATDSTISFYSLPLKRTAQHATHGVLIDWQLTGRAGDQRTGVFTNIGIMNPNDGKHGNAFHFTLTNKDGFRIADKVADTLPRPVQVSEHDLDGDQRADLLVCGFGHNTGSLFWMKNIGEGKYERKMLKAIPGAIKAYITDYNKDGKMDVVVLFAQGYKGISVFLNNGQGHFTEKILLEFPAVYGSSYFEMTDLNKDGVLDILYTCGDNADYTADVLKPYHGIYGYLNKGNDRFEQAFFFPMHGCYKAMARDFDLDGDVDIAAISYFPSPKQPEESFIYLEQVNQFSFKPALIREALQGNWLTMDAGDADGDGDVDIVIGSLLPPTPQGSVVKRVNENKPAFLLLENKINKN